MSLNIISPATIYLGSAQGSSSGSSVYTQTIFDGNVGSTLDVSPLSLENTIAIERNGQKIYESDTNITRDYSINGSVITFVKPLIITDRIVVISSNIAPIDLSAYKLKAQTITIDTTSITIAEIKANKNYVFSNNAITDITLSGCETSFEETSIEFSTGNSAPTLTDNSGITWVDGATPVLSANKSYLIVIFNKLGFIREY